MVHHRLQLHFDHYKDQDCVLAKARTCSDCEVVGIENDEVPKMMAAEEKMYVVLSGEKLMEARRARTSDQKKQVAWHREANAAVMFFAGYYPNYNKFRHFEVVRGEPVFRRPEWAYC